MKRSIVLALLIIIVLSFVSFAYVNDSALLTNDTKVNNSNGAVGSAIEEVLTLGTENIINNLRNDSIFYSHFSQNNTDIGNFSLENDSSQSESIKAYIKPKNTYKLKNEIKTLRVNDSAPVILQIKEKGYARISEKLVHAKHSKNSLIYEILNGSEIENLTVDPDVIAVWPDLTTTSFLDSSVTQIGVDYLWKTNLSGTGIKMAILDTGIDASHEMFTNRIIIVEDFTTDGHPDDYYGHGTHVAGIAAGNGFYTGVGYNATIYSGKVLSDSGSGQLSWLIEGIDWAIDNDVDIISMSLGAVYSGDPEEQLGSPEVLKVQEAINAGISVVIAAGNCNAGHCGTFTGVTTPGIARYAITVGAVDDNNNSADFSSGGYIADYIKPDIVAPGVSICSSVPGGYDCKSGTSMATPHVAGAIALLLEHADLSPLGIKQLLENNSVDLGVPGKDTRYGEGLLNLGIDLTNASNITLIEGDDSYQFHIPTFVAGYPNVLGLMVANNGNCTKKCPPRKLEITFEIEELGTISSETLKDNIKHGDYTIFEMDWTPQVPGKHLLTITIHEHKEDPVIFHKEVQVLPTEPLNQIHEVRLMLR